MRPSACRLAIGEAVRYPVPKRREESMPVESWRHRTVESNGIRLHLVEEGDGFPVVLCHGFPELWYSWRHQIPARRWPPPGCGR